MQYLLYYKLTLLDHLILILHQFFNFKIPTKRIKKY
jgi:hypothetical protein